MTTQTQTRLLEREPQVIVRDAAYAVTAIADEAITNVRSLTAKVEKLRDEAPSKAKELRTTAPDRLKALPDDAQSRVKDLREKATKSADERLASFEAQFDAKAAAGADRVATLKGNEHVTRVTTAFEPVTDQVKIAKTQVKGAVTSVRKTVDAALEAGRTQAGNAKSQVKAAATSTRKTVDAVVGAGRDLAS